MLRLQLLTASLEDLLPLLLTKPPTYAFPSLLSFLPLPPSGARKSSELTPQQVSRPGRKGPAGQARIDLPLPAAGQRDLVPFTCPMRAESLLFQKQPGPGRMAHPSRKNANKQLAINLKEGAQEPIQPGNLNRRVLKCKLPGSG